MRTPFFFFSFLFSFSLSFFLSFPFFVVIVVFLGWHLQHMEIPKLGNESEVQLPAYTTQHQIRAMSATYTAAHGNARSLTPQTRPGIKSMSLWMLVGFVTAEPQQELQLHFFFFLKGKQTEMMLSLPGPPAKASLMFSSTLCPLSSWLKT